jgi:hypothetical protein
LAGGFERALLWGALGSFLLWGMHGIFDTPYWKNDMSVEFWLVAAIQVAATRRLLSNPGPKEPAGRP